MKQLILLVHLFFSSVLLAQGDNPDSLFHEAKLLAEQSKYGDAIRIMDELHNSYPNNRDYVVYLSRLYYWSNNPTSAKQHLMHAQSPESLDKESLDLLIQLEIALSEWRSVQHLTDLGKKKFSDNTHHYSLLQAIAFEQQNKDREALNLLQTIPTSSEDYPAADYLRTQLLKKQKNSISTGYLLTSFDQGTYENQHIGFVEYGRKFKRSSHVLRVNYANMFGEQALQLETDAYIPIKKLGYLYTNAGVGEKSSIFPQIRLGTEYYFEKKQWSASIGAKYLHFNSSNTPWLFTGHLGYQTKQGWGANYRPYVALINSNSTFLSHLFYLRKTFINKESYIQLDFQYGTLPYFFFTNEVLSRLAAYRTGFNLRFRIKQNWFVQPIFMYEYEEYTPNKFRNRYTYQLILSRRF